FNPVLEALESQSAQYAVVARLSPSFRSLLPGLRYEPVNRDWEIADFEHRSHGWRKARRFAVARRLVPELETQPTLFTLGRYLHRAWVTDLPLTPAGVWHFYDGRATMERRIRELRQDFALPKIPTRSFAANALYNLVTAFQRTCLEPNWQSFTLQKLRFNLFLLPGEITHPQNRPVMRLKASPFVEKTAHQILARTRKLKPLRA
ncbi:MAG: transposase, partial [Gemmataceae bacterium]